MIHLYFYVPEMHLEEVKNAIFLAGAGKVGNYSCCSWETKGIGQFMPLQGSNPFIGKVDQIQRITEVKVETVCSKENLVEVLRALKNAHPYETPAYGFFEIN